MTEVFRRFREFTPKKRDAESDTGPKPLDILAATQDAVDWGGYREILIIADGSVDFSACRALLINHNPDQIAGPLSDIVASNGEINCSALVSPDAELESGVMVQAAIDDGSLRGVSIGYTYSMANTVFDEESRTLTVVKWRLLEVTLTPIPADASAKVRSLPSEISSKRAALPAPSTTEARVTEANKETPNTQGQESAVDLTKHTEATRAAAIKEAREISVLARSHDLNGEDYLGMERSAAIEKMLTDSATKRATDLKQGVGGVATITADKADKVRDAVSNAIMAQAFPTAKIENLGFNGMRALDMIRNYAIQMGEPAASWTREDLAHYALGRHENMRGKRSAANVTTGSFPTFVFLNALNKSLIKGYEMGSSSIKYQDLVSRRSVPDFRQFSIGQLGAGNLTKTLEDVAFPELSKADGVYQDTVKMWGATMALTFQALVNDDMGEFSRELAMAGVIAQKTIDRRVFQRLLMGTSAVEATSTWTSNTSSGGSLVYTTADGVYGARGKLDVVTTALMVKLGLDGNPLGTMAKYLVVPPLLANQARGVVGAPGNGQVSNQSNDLTVITSPWLSASALTGNSTTSYYVVADPNEVTGLVLSTITGMDTPQVMQYDAGAVAALKWKIFLPFEASLAYLSVSGTNTVAAVQQGTT